MEGGYKSYKGYKGYKGTKRTGDSFYDVTFVTLVTFLTPFSAPLGKQLENTLLVCLANSSFGDESGH
jgi:hypothetical protein